MPNDYILRSDVEKMIKDKIEETIKYGISTDEAQYFRILGRKLALKELLSELSSIQSVDRWKELIKIKPNQYDGCLVLTNTGEYLTCIWLSELEGGEIFFHFEDNNGNIIDNVTHWMPLPLPPNN